MARQFGAETIVLAEINPERLAQAQAFGFDRLVNPSADDLETIVKDLTDGIGADVVIVAAPAIAPQEQALRLVRKRGTVCLFASLPVGACTLALDSRMIHYGEIRVMGASDSTPAQVSRSVDIIAKQEIPVARLASHVLKLDDVFEAFELMQTGQALRVVLTP
jgi:L-iditol 2-dehydrogenase